MLTRLHDIEHNDTQNNNKKHDSVLTTLTISYYWPNYIIYFLLALSANF